MIAELGHFALIIACVFAILQTFIPLYGVRTQNAALQHFAQPMAWGQFIFLFISFILLTVCFLIDDFSVKYVATNSNSALPVFYKVSAVWAAHEGSLLMWVLILAGWSFAVAIFSKALPLDMLARVLGVMGIVSVGFLFFTLLTSNPFERLLPVYPQDGRDLNPLLQDIGLIIHPPMLYMGYVGFSVAFAFAIAALMSGKLDAAWAKWSRPWTNVAWAFLTVGIALGSWWAYYELGWGGWWFWDPVENASFMPWLVGAALVHSLAVTEKRGLFKSWTVLLAIFAFSLSLLGTFLVRSGVLTSVHAFASDPSRGVFILALLGITVCGSLLLFAMRAPTVSRYVQFNLLSRDLFLLVNNILLLISAVAILIGTLYPLVYDAMGLGKLSIGAPFFNKVFLPIMAVLSLFLGVGHVLRWKQDRLQRITKHLTISALVSVSAGFAFPYVYGYDLHLGATLSLMLAFWIITSSLLNIFEGKGKGIVSKLKKQSLAYYGMHMAHLGFAITVIGGVMVSIYNEEHDIKMQPNDTIQIQDYTFKFIRIEPIKGPNYVADRGHFEVYKDGAFYLDMYPEKRVYNVQKNMMTEAAIDAGFTRDLFIALGEPLGGDAWAVRVHCKPFIRFLWLGAIFMGLGAVLAVLDKRYRNKKKVS